LLRKIDLGSGGAPARDVDASSNPFGALGQPERPSGPYGQRTELKNLPSSRTKLFNHPHFSNPNNTPKEIGGVELSVNNP
jgi:hypothetical protein